MFVWAVHYLGVEEQWEGQWLKFWDNYRDVEDTSFDIVDLEVSVDDMILIDWKHIPWIDYYMSIQVFGWSCIIVVFYSVPIHILMDVFQLKYFILDLFGITVHLRETPSLLVEEDYPSVLQWDIYPSRRYVWWVLILKKLNNHVEVFQGTPLWIGNNFCIVIDSILIIELDKNTVFGNAI